MPIHDADVQFSKDQVVTSNGNSDSTVARDAQTNLGGGQRIRPYVHISAVSGTSPTLQVKLVGADDSGFSTNKITIDDSGTVSSLAAEDSIHMAIPSHTPKKHFRMEYTVGGTSPSFTITSGLRLSDQTRPVPV